MGKLKVLPANIANMIAAGEVVQRPSSVVKELMENAIDADATQISVIVSDAGRTLIQVIDNGCGMSPADAVLCFERHATSKIAGVDDLNEILTYGFRGEALASIAAVAEVTLKTRRASDETATQVVIGDYGTVKTSSVAAPVGSNFAVRNLFYNTPARRKFLKSDNVELKHIIEEFTRVALTRPNIGFSLSSNGKDVYVLKPAKSLKFRILDLLGTSVVGDVVDIDEQTSVAHISGFIGRPDTAKKTLGNQYFFVNNRFFRSSYMHKAVMKAYEEYLPEGLTPSYFIWLECDPHTVDVNISPTKSEVKFEEDSIIFQMIYACVKGVLGKNAFGGGIDFDTEGSVTMPQIGKTYEAYRGQIDAPVPTLDPDYDPFKMSSISPEFDPEPRQPSSAVNRRQDYGRLFEESPVAQVNSLVISGKYIVTKAASGLMIVNIRRAWERIIYERSLKALATGEVVSQQTLFPIQVQVGPQAVLLFEEHAAELSALGFDISVFGKDTVVVSGVPEGYSAEEGKVQQMVQDMIFVLSDETGGLAETVNSALAAKFATLGAMNTGDIMSALQAQNLIDTLFACDNAERTPAGRKIVSIMALEEIDKLFSK